MSDRVKLSGCGSHPSFVPGSLRSSLASRLPRSSRIISSRLRRSVIKLSWDCPCRGELLSHCGAWLVLLACPLALCADITPMTWTVYTTRRPIIDWEKYCACCRRGAFSAGTKQAQALARGPGRHDSIIESPLTHAICAYIIRYRMWRVLLDFWSKRT